MKGSILGQAAVILAVAALAFCPSVSAQDEGAAEGDAQQNGSSRPERVFTALLRCVRAENADVQILKPRTKEWAAAEEGRYYPLGSTVRVKPLTEAACVTFAFGEKASVTVNGAAVFATEEGVYGAAERTLILKEGTLALDLPRTLKEGLFSVKAPFFMCSNLAGQSQFTYAATGDGDEAVVRCVTGTMALAGRHYSIARMGAANQIRIRTTGDDLFTSLRGESGDCKVVLDQGVVAQKNYETGETADVAKTLEFTLSPKCAIKIFRATSEVGGRTVVSMMTFNALGEMVNRCAYAEKRSNVNSGELVVAPVLETEKTAKDAADGAEEAEDVEAVSGDAAEAKTETEEEPAAE